MYRFIFNKNGSPIVFYNCSVPFHKQYVNFPFASKRPNSIHSQARLFSAKKAGMRNGSNKCTESRLFAIKIFQAFNFFQTFNFTEALLPAE